MSRTAKHLIRELQDAVADNDGRDLWVGLVSMHDEGVEYGFEEFVSTHVRREPDGSTPTVVITYN